MRRIPTRRKDRAQKHLKSLSRYKEKKRKESSMLRFQQIFDLMWITLITVNQSNLLSITKIYEILKPFTQIYSS
jgi:septum formation inhibitor-activating ATPase MinD